MPDLMIDLITSLDGCASADGWPGLWGVECPGYVAWLDEPEQQDHVILMGATTYRLMHGFGETGAEDVSDLTRMSKIVFSSTLTEPLGWANTQMVAGDPIQAVRALKETGDRPLHTLGSLTLARTLLRAGLVDRLRVGVFPFITGESGQERVYDDWPDVALDLITTRVFDGQVQVSDYATTLLDGPPGA